MSKEDNSSINDIISDNSGFKTSPVDDLFDIIEQDDSVQSDGDNAGITQDNISEQYDMQSEDVDFSQFGDLFSDEGTVQDTGIVQDENQGPYDAQSENVDVSQYGDLVSDDGLVEDAGIVQDNVQGQYDTQSSDTNFVDTLDFQNGFSDLAPEEENEAYSGYQETGMSDEAVYDFGDASSVTNDGFEMEADQMAGAEGQQDISEENQDDDSYLSDDDLEDLDDEDYEQTMIITEGTTITGSITTDCSLDVYGTINGDILCNGKLLISGKVIGNSHADEIMISAHRIEGNIESDGVVKIGQGAVIIGNISAGAAAIAGAVKGDLDVKGTVILDSTAVIKGNIKAKSVQLINGAVLEGFCSLEYANSNVDDIFNQE